MTPLPGTTLAIGAGVGPATQDLSRSYALGWGGVASIGVGMRSPAHGSHDDGLPGMPALADPPLYFAGVLAPDLAAGLEPPGTARSRTSVSRI